MEPIMTGDEIVISGIAGKFPNSENINELQKNLLNKIDCVTDSKVRWNFENPNIPPRIGTMKSIDAFDRIFFGIHSKLVDCMDPMVRMMIETTYEAITDAGINPKELKGSKSAVFTGSSFSESEKTFFFEKLEQTGFGLLGASRAMLANRLSFFFGLTGPSVNVDTTCCGGVTALEQGIAALKEGRAESVIIGASNVILHPNISYQLTQLGLLSPEGITKSFDNEANGYARSEGLVVLFLQKARDAKRIYAEVKSAHMFFGSVNDNYSFFFPTHDSQSKTMQMTLKEAGISEKDIFYVEADGSGVKDIDAEEVRAIDEVYNKERNSPLLIGSIKSNIGSCSAVNPLNGIIKVITAMEKGFIPPNLNFKESSDKIPAIKEGRCQVVTELTPWTGDYAVVNSLGLSGASANVVLKNYKKEKKNGGKPDDNLSRLVAVSGCTEEAVDVLLSDLESRPADVEMLQLLYDVFETETPSHLYRGYTLLPAEGMVKNKTREIQFNTGLKREIWYMFSGMGSQWVGMGEALLEIPVFAEAIKKCDRVLKPRGIDIVQIITEKDPKMFDNIVNSFVGIAAIQIGLVDVLDSVGVRPDFLIGHSVGELGCAYADGCFTAEQMVLAALSRGLASVETEMPRGSMAAVGLGYEEIKNLCPPDIDVACHNSSNSSTISGPAESMKTFVAHLTNKKIFAKEVACSNIAYHSRYIAPAGEKLRKYLQEVIPDPKPRSHRWVSSSVPRDEWNSARARLSSAEYHTNNLLNAVLFAETAKSIPSHAVVIEIAPHGLLQAIVKKSLPEKVLNIPLTKRGHPDNVSFLFAALGKIYNADYNVKLSNLYPKVNYPVSRGTSSISSIIRWDHSANWYTNFFKQSVEVKEGEIKFTINLKDENWGFLKDAKINDKVIVPSSLYLTLAWQVLKTLKEETEESVVYENIKIHKHLVEIPKDTNIDLIVMVQKGTGNFEITNKKELLCSGTIQTTNNPKQECSLIPKPADKDYQDLRESDIYTELQMRGLEYSGSFRCISKASGNGSNGLMVWKDDWTTFLEGMIQMHILGNDTREAQVPITIRKIIIDLNLQKEVISKSEEIPVSVYKGQETVNAGGVQMEGIAHELILHEAWRNNVITEKLQIVPGTDGAASNLTDILKITVQLLQNNFKTSNLIQVVNDDSEDLKNVKPVLDNILEKSAAENKKYKVDVVPSTSLTGNKSDFTNVALLVLSNIEKYTPEIISNIISDGKFVLAFTESKNAETVLKMMQSLGVGLVLRKYPSKNKIALLLRQKQTTCKTTVLDINDSKDWSSQIKTVLKSKDYDRLIIAIRSKQCSYLCKNIEVLQKERNGHKIQIVDIQDPKVSNFSLDDSLISSHMDLDLKMNILLPGKVWGTYVHTPIASNICQAENWIAKQMISSDLESIKWVEGFFKRSEDAVKVEYSAVNQGDILSASTKTSSEDIVNNRLEMKSFGQEYSGINSQGNRVMGIVQNAAFSNCVESNMNFTWKIPEYWSLEDAATVPLAYATAYWALIKGELQNNESIFIYDGSCSIGQATINLASNITSQVFTGYATNSDKHNLKSSFSNIPENHLISASSTFPDQILAKTNGKGVDLVIYNGDDLNIIETCLMCVKRQGKIVIVGDLHQAFSKSVGMQIFLRELGIFSIVPKKIINLDLATKKKLSQLIENGLLNRTVKPLPRCVYSREMLNEAFIYAASKDVFGKVLVKIQPEDRKNEAPTIPRFLCKSEASYLIIDGLSDLGLELVDFLVVRGARSIVIASETKNTRAFSNHRISLWRSYGVSVTVREELDLTHRENGNALLEEVGTLGVVDAIFDLQRLDNLSTRSSNSKYLFTKHLFEESKQRCPKLRQFVVFSTSKVVGESIDDFLLREIELTQICQPNSKGITGLLILLGPVSGIEEKTPVHERKVPLLSISSIIKQLDVLTGSNTSIASIYHKLEDDTEKVQEHFHVIEETEKSKFVKYIYSEHSVAVIPRFKSTDEK